MFEDECIAQVIQWERKFGWVGTYFTRADCAARLGRDLTDVEWELISTDSRWLDIGNELSDLGIDWVADTVFDLIPE